MQQKLCWYPTGNQIKNDSTIIYYWIACNMCRLDIVLMHFFSQLDSKFRQIRICSHAFEVDCIWTFWMKIISDDFQTNFMCFVFFFFVLVRSQNHLLNIFPNYFGWECICRHSNWPPFELSTTVVVNVSPKGLLWQWTIFKQIKINTILTPIMPINIGHSLAYLWRW